MLVINAIQSSFFFCDILSYYQFNILMQVWHKIILILIRGNEFGFDSELYLKNIHFAFPKEYSWQNKETKITQNASELPKPQSYEVGWHLVFIHPFFYTILLLNIAPIIVILEHFPLPNSIPSIAQKKLKTLTRNILLYTLISGFLMFATNSLSTYNKNKRLVII